MTNEFLQYKDLFLQSGRENLQLLNESLLKLEKDAADAAAIADAFRASHSLKSENAAMGFEQTAYLCHTIEDIFSEIKAGKSQVTPELANLLFASLDAITASLDSVEQTDKESDGLKEKIDGLKQLTGVQTIGSGKSPARTDNPQEAKAPTQATPAAPHIKTIPVRVEQLDEMMDLIEELVIDRLALKQLVHDIKNAKLRTYYEKAGRTSDALQFQVMKIRAVPVKLVFDHFPRAVRDLAQNLGKPIELVVEGADLELDRTLVERLDEPLIHLIRNAADHGLTETGGIIRLKARHEKDYAVIEVTDNGGGIDWAALAAKAGVASADPGDLKDVLFSGISTSEKVTEISGRGVGLGAVKKVIEDFGGTIDVESEPGKGTTFRIHLPLTLSVMQALIVRVGQNRYVIPAIVIDRSVKILAQQRKKIAEQEVFVLDGTEIPLISLRHTFGEAASSSAASDEAQASASALAVIVSAGNERLGLLVDDVLETSQITVKPVPDILKTNRAFSGTTILGDGRSALLIHPPGLM